MLALFAILASAVPAVSQDSEKPVNVTGKIVDAENGAGLEFATVSFYTADSALVTGTVTDLQGNFKIELQPGEYYALIQFVSYQDKYFSGIVLGEGRRNFKLETIAVQSDTETLEEVVVTGEKGQMEMDFDKRIFNVANDPSNIGRTATDLLDNVPSVTVDTEGNVSLRGSGNVRILIDGKPSGLVGIDGSGGLQSLQGGLIERIEVITNPSVRYEAEGMAGVINIVLKKEERTGINGTFETTAGYPSNYGLNSSVNFRRENVNYFLNYGANYRQRPGSGSSFQRFSLADTSFVTRRQQDRTRGGWAHNFRGGADFFINPKNVLTLSGVVRLEDSENTNNLVYSDYNSLDELQQETLRRDVEQEDEFNTEFTMNYEKSFDEEERKWTAYAQFRDNNETEESDIIEQMLSGEDPDLISLQQQSLNEEKERNILLQSDYVHPFSDDGKWEAGFRSTFRTINTDYLVEELDENGTWSSLENFTNTFNYYENVHALYGLLANKHGKVSYQAGVRAELSDIETHLEQTDERNDRLYANLFPSIHLNYHLNEIQSFQVSYSRRISRPRFWSLNPFSSFSDARNIRTGNPNLNPEFTDSYEVGYLFNGQTSTFYGGVYNRRTQDVTQRVNYVDEEGVTFSLPLNLASENAYGLESNLSKDLTSWWTANANFNFYRSIIEGSYNGESLNADTYTWNGRLTSRVTFWDKTNFQLNGFYRAPQNTPQGRRLSFYALDAGISKDILNGNGTINMSVRDIFNTRRWRGITQGEDFYQESNFQWRARQFIVSFVYRLNQQNRDGRKESRGDYDGEEGEF